MWVHFRDEKPTDEDKAPEHLFHMSRVSHVKPSQTMSEISNTKERYNTQCSFQSFMCLDLSIRTNHNLQIKHIT